LGIAGEGWEDSRGSRIRLSACAFWLFVCAFLERVKLVFSFLAWYLALGILQRLMLKQKDANPSMKNINHGGQLAR